MVGGGHARQLLEEPGEGIVRAAVALQRLALQAVDGIGEQRAQNLIAKRPYTAVEEAAMVDGIGIGTFKNLVASVKPAPKADSKETDNDKEKKEKTAKKEKEKAKPAEKKTIPPAPAKKE